MKTKLTALLMAIFFTVSVTGMAAAASIKCSVESVEDGKVVLQCGDKAEKIKIGTEVKVKTIVKRKAVEGC
jgi:hypothetical protein